MNKKQIKALTNDELVRAFAIAVKDSVIIANFPSKRSGVKAEKIEDALRDEILLRFEVKA